MSRFSELITKDKLPANEQEELRRIALALEGTVNDVGTVIGPSGTVARLRAGSVVLDNAGMHTYLGGVETGRIEADGDFFLGTNIAAAATTSLALFTNAQTYNSESIGAGDLLIGDNTASKANILWDKSTGTLLFRGGTTTQAHINTSGAIIAGGGQVAINGEGLQLQGGSGTANAINWYPAVVGTGGGYSKIWTQILGTTPNRYSDLTIQSFGESGGAGFGQIQITGVNRTSGYTQNWAVDGGNNRIRGIVVGAGGQTEFFINAGEIVANEAGIDCDFRVESDGNANMLVVDGGANRVGIGVVPVTTATIEGALTLKEQAAADTDTAAYGQLWVKTATPNELWFTDDAGTDAQLGTGGGYTEGARVYNSGDETISNATWTYLTFDSERYDTDSIHSTASNTSRLTCVTAGKYEIVGNVVFAPNATGNRSVRIQLNGGATGDRIGHQQMTAMGGGWQTSLNVVCQYILAADDYVELGVYQDSTGNLAVSSLANYSPEFSMQRIG